MSSSILRNYSNDLLFSINYFSTKVNKFLHFTVFYSCIEFSYSCDISGVIKLSLTEGRPRSKTSEVRMPTVMTSTRKKEEKAKIKFVKNYLRRKFVGGERRRVNKTVRNNSMKRSLINRRFRPSEN